MGISSSKPRDVQSKYFADFEAKLPDLSGKTIAITGCTTGTGFVVARSCVRKKADHVLLLNRPSERATAAEKALKEEAASTSSSTKIETIPCDLQDFDSVKAAAAAIKSKVSSLDVLCNNAGVMALEDVATKDGYDVQMQTNHLSHFLLTKELMPLLKKAAKDKGEARIVNHSSAARNMTSGGLKAEYFEKRGGNLGGNGSSMLFGGARWKRYSQTKLANSVFTNALVPKLEGTGIKAVVAAPGLAATNLQVTTHQTGGMGYAYWIMLFAQSAEDGTMPLLAACFDPSTESGDFWEPNGYGRMSGEAIKVNWDKNSKDAEQGKMLWEKSEEACGKLEI